MKDDLKNVNFTDHILFLVSSRGLTVMEAVIHTHEEYDVEIEKLASLVKSSPKLKGQLLAEATKLNMMKK